MQVTDANNVKIYNLSSGKSLPEWLSERKRRNLLKKNVDVRRRIELIQEFEMPGVSTTIRVSPDGNYILATGIYKPRVKCFDVNNLSLKFERCFDSEAGTFEVLSDDYSKLVFLQCDRYIEFHSAEGRYYRLRIPKFGRDMKHHYPSSDLFVVGASSEIYRLNLERGQFMPPYTSTAASINKIDINPAHHLVICGTQNGTVEAWDPRSKSLVGTLDCAFHCVNETKSLETFPSITALKFNDALSFGVGTASGHVLLYDIRSRKPQYVKDHMNNLPIKDVDFHYQQELIYSMDSSIVKIWNRNNGKLYASIESSTEFNNLCVVPNTGMLFIANENTKMQTYYIPSLGPAPKWASFLDSLTEELEESNYETVYDDYKFVTKAELENLGLDHLIGTNLLRAYMHGYFMDVRLYRKAKSVANPFEFEEYRKRKIRETIEKDRASRVQVDKLPKVNKDLALKLMNDSVNLKKKKANAGSLLTDDRFKALFDNPELEIDKNAEEYRLLNPVVTRLDAAKKKELKKKLAVEEEVDEEAQNSDDSSLFAASEEEESSDDEDQSWTKEVKKQHKLIKREKAREEREQERAKQREPVMIGLRQGEDIFSKKSKATLGEQVKNESEVKMLNSIGNREMTFSTVKNRRDKQMNARNAQHREERKKIVRPVFKAKFRKPFNKRR